MARYQRTVRLCLPAEQVEDAMQTFLTQNRFYFSPWQGETCWAADQGPARQVRFFQYRYDGETLTLTAWLRQGIQGESGLDGWAALDQKVPYRRALFDLCRRLLESSPEKGQTQDWMKAEQSRLRRQGSIFVLALLAAGALIAWTMARWFPFAA